MGLRRTKVEYNKTPTFPKTEDLHIEKEPPPLTRKVPPAFAVMSACTTPIEPLKAAVWIGLCKSASR
jgi:hypothetical protein